MEINAFITALAPATDSIAAPPTTTVPTPPVALASSTVFVPGIPVLPAYAKPFPDISRIYVFSRQNYK